MTELDTLLDARNLPDVLTDNAGRKINDAEMFEARKQEIRRLLQDREYGKIPPKPDRLTVTKTETVTKFCAGDATLCHLSFDVELGAERFSFPVMEMMPKHAPGVRVPAFVFLNFRPNAFDDYLPTEEVMDRGYAVFRIYYKDIAGDNDDFESLCAKHLSGDRKSEKDAPGKLAMWAWAAMRVMDHLQTREDIDLGHVAVIGHSRLGKTALLTAAFDERFQYAISNDSGCAGAAIERGKVGERYKQIVGQFPFWFCPRFVEEAKAEEPLPFDQHFLLSLIPPRNLLVGSAEDDLWADPASEFLGTYKTNEIYRLYGMKGLICPDSIPDPVTIYNEGDASYHVRRGVHYLGRADWLAYMDFIDRKRAKR